MPALRIVFDGENAQKPIIAELVRNLGIDVNILAADVKRIGEKSYGQMMIALPDKLDERKAVLDFLQSQGLTVKEVYPQ